MRRRPAVVGTFIASRGELCHIAIKFSSRTVRAKNAEPRQSFGGAGLPDCRRAASDSGWPRHSRVGVAQRQEGPGRVPESPADPFAAVRGDRCRKRFSDVRELSWSLSRPSAAPTLERRGHPPKLWRGLENADEQVGASGAPPIFVENRRVLRVGGATRIRSSRAMNCQSSCWRNQIGSAFLAMNSSTTSPSIR